MTRILVVEDERVIAEGLRDNLELEGYEVELVTDGRAAERRALEQAFDLILLDIMLPGKDGLSVCRALRDAGVCTPIVILTARGRESDKVNGLDQGADDYITKPFGQKELLARVKAALRRSQDFSGAARADLYESDRLRIDFRRLEAELDGQVLHLTATEFKLLRALVHHAGEVLTLDRLIDLVWGTGHVQSDRVVYTHVNNLRLKMARLSKDREWIANVRGLGYRFEG